MTVTGGALSLTGGGITDGTINGATEYFGFQAIKNPDPVNDLHAIMLKLLAFNHERITFRHAGCDFRLTDGFSNVVQEVINAGRDRADRPIQAG